MGLSIAVKERDLKRGFLRSGIQPGRFQYMRKDLGN